MRGGLVILIVFTIVTFIIDALTNKCVQRNFEVGVLTFTHHFVYNYALLGWLLDDFAALAVYIALPFIASLHWRVSNCVVNDVIDDICGEKKDFMHLGRQLGVPHSFAMTVMGIGWCIAVYKMYRILRDRPRGPKEAIPPPWCWNKKCSAYKAQNRKTCTGNICST